MARKTIASIVHTYYSIRPTNRFILFYMQRIEKLTQSQIDRFPEWVDKWTRIGLCTDPADRARAEQAICLSYQLGWKDPPQKIVWLGSPLGNSLARYILGIKENGISSSVRTHVWAGVRDSVRASVWDIVWAGVQNSVWAGVQHSVWAGVQASVRDIVRTSMRASMGNSIYGQHESGWLSFYSFFREICGLQEQTQKLVGLLELAQSCGWILPHENICFASERHNILNRDAQGRLHSTSGPALMYPDGFGIWAVHGVRLPEYVIERPQEITCAKIQKEDNAEIRRVMLDQYGIPRYIHDVGATEMARDDWGILYRIHMPNDEPIMMVKYQNSTPDEYGTRREYFHRVHPELRPIFFVGEDGTRKLGEPQSMTPLNAIASFHGLYGNEYNPEVQT